MPKNKNVRICKGCEVKIAEGECTNCGERSYPKTLDRLGHCSDCRALEDRYAYIDNTEKKHYCKNCQEPVEDITLNYCNSCRIETDMCIYCNKTTKPITEFACYECKRNRMTAEKS